MYRIHLVLNKIHDMKKIGKLLKNHNNDPRQKITITLSLFYSKYAFRKSAIQSTTVGF
jgi:hypothetical protein